MQSVISICWRQIDLYIAMDKSFIFFSIFLFQVMELVKSIAAVSILFSIPGSKKYSSSEHFIFYSKKYSSSEHFIF